MNKWIAEFELEDGDTMPEHMDLEYKGVKIDFYCKPLEQEPKIGHWKYFQNEKGDWMNVCSNCNSDCGVGYPYNYCPNCGCSMKGELDTRHDR